MTNYKRKCLELVWYMASTWAWKATNSNINAGWVVHSINGNWPFIHKLLLSTYCILGWDSESYSPAPDNGLLQPACKKNCKSLSRNRCNYFNFTIACPLVDNNQRCFCRNKCTVTRKDPRVVKTSVWHLPHMTPPTNNQFSTLHWYTCQGWGRRQRSATLSGSPAESVVQWRNLCCVLRKM